MWKGKAAVPDDLPFIISINASRVVGWVSVLGAGRILHSKKRTFPICRGERAEPAAGIITCGDSAEAPHPFRAHKHK